MNAYRLDDALSPVGDGEATGTQPLILLFNLKQWADRLEAENVPPVDQMLSHNRFCKAEVYQARLTGTFHIPYAYAHAPAVDFFYCFSGRHLIFVDQSGYVKAQIERLAAAGKKEKKHTLGRFFADFLEEITENDLYALEQLEDQIEQLEDAVLAGKEARFNHHMMALRKRVSVLYRYYAQLENVGQILQENENGFFTAGEARLFHLFSERMSRLQSQTLMLREYLMQVREAYQSQVDIRQNSIMKVLTVVTAVFMPLTLITGWYGMNFRVMPELEWAYGYPLVIAVSVLVVLFCIWICKRKKFW